MESSGHKRQTYSSNTANSSSGCITTSKVFDKETQQGCATNLSMEKLSASFVANPSVFNTLSQQSTQDQASNLGMYLNLLRSQLSGELSSLQSQSLDYVLSTLTVRQHQLGNGHLPQPHILFQLQQQQLQQQLQAQLQRLQQQYPHQHRQQSLSDMPPECQKLVQHLVQHLNISPQEDRASSPTSPVPHCCHGNTNERSGPSNLNVTPVGTGEYSPVPPMDASHLNNDMATSLFIKNRLQSQQWQQKHEQKHGCYNIQQQQQQHSAFNSTAFPKSALTSASALELSTARPNQITSDVYTTTRSPPPPLPPLPPRTAATTLPTTAAVHIGNHQHHNTINDSSLHGSFGSFSSGSDRDEHPTIHSINHNISKPAAGWRSRSSSAVSRRRTRQRSTSLSILAMRAAVSQSSMSATSQPSSSNSAITNSPASISSKSADANRRRGLSVDSATHPRAPTFEILDLASRLTFDSRASSLSSIGEADIPATSNPFSYECAEKYPCNPSRCSKKAHPCPHPLCGKNFPSHSKLVRHIRVHTGEKPFVCYVCNTRFTQRCSLKTHIKRHAEADISRAYGSLDIALSPSSDLSHPWTQQNFLSPQHHQPGQEQAQATSMSLPFSPSVDSSPKTPSLNCPNVASQHMRQQSSAFLETHLSKSLKNEQNVSARSTLSLAHSGRFTSNPTPSECSLNHLPQTANDQPCSVNDIQHHAQQHASNFNQFEELQDKHHQRQRFSNINLSNVSHENSTSPSPANLHPKYAINETSSTSMQGNNLTPLNYSGQELGQVHYSHESNDTYNSIVDSDDEQFGNLFENFRNGKVSLDLLDRVLDETCSSIDFS